MARSLIRSAGAMILASVLLVVSGVVAQAFYWPNPSAAVNLSAPSQNAHDPQITTSTDGTTMTAVWSRNNGSNNIVQAATSTDGGVNWSSAVDLSAPGQNANFPQIAASTDGATLTAVWQRSNGASPSRTIVQAATSTDTGATWSTPVDLSAPGQNAARPQIATSTDGTTTTVVWYRNNGSSLVVQAATSTDTGATWSTAVEVSATGEDARDPQITASANGATLTAVWERSNGTNSIVQAATSTNTGATWTTPVDLSDPGQDAIFPQLAGSSDDATLTAIWERSNGTNSIVQAATSTDTGAAWTTPVDLSATGQDAHSPKIAVSADGATATAVWERNNGANWIVQSATSTDTGATWSPTVDLSATGQDALSPQIAASADGATATAVWERTNGTNSIAQSATSTDTGATWSAPVDLSATGQDSVKPQIAVSGDGARATAVWQRFDGSHYIVQTLTGASTLTAGPLTFPSGGSFGSATVGQATSLTVTVSNTGNAEATPTAIDVTGNGVAITGGTCATSTPIAAGETCTVTVSWTPAVAGSLTGAALTIAYPDGDSANDSLTLTGTATASPNNRLPQSQAPVSKKLASPGRSVVNIKRARTVQGQPMKASVSKVRVTGLQARGDIRCYKAVTGPQRKLTLNVTGACKKVTIWVKYTAPGNTTYRPYTNTIRFIGKR